MNKTCRLFICFAAFLIIGTSCAPVRSYQKAYINDAEMSLANRKAERMQSNFLNYREGASGANGGKTGGGCGCN